MRNSTGGIGLLLVGVLVCVGWALWRTRWDTTTDHTSSAQPSGAPPVEELGPNAAAHKLSEIAPDVTDAGVTRERVPSRIRVISKHQEPIEGVRAMSITL